MTEHAPEPVEISAHFRPGEWTEESLESHVAHYRRKLLDMGAVDRAIGVVVHRLDDGSVDLIASWNTDA